MDELPPDGELETTFATEIMGATHGDSVAAASSKRPSVW
jgi:hypothetical protein